jgi:sulfotransferase family protein
MSTDVCFIGGFGRSGSTLLERLVAMLPGVCGLGEVLQVWQRGVRDNELCACGEPFHGCPFWQAVGAEAFGGWHRMDVDAIQSLRRRVDRLRHIPADIVASKQATRSAALRDYADMFARIYAAAAQVSSASVVVDSSKNASTAYALRVHEDVSLRVVHMVRDSRGVAFSWTKRVERPEVHNGGRQMLMDRYSPALSALLWDAHNVAFGVMAKLGVPVKRVLYEELLADPTATVASIADFIGVCSAGAEGLVGGGKVRLERTHQVAGNPMRFQTGELNLRRDDAWRVDFPAANRRLVSALTAPLMLRYGYLRETDG